MLYLWFPSSVGPTCPASCSVGSTPTPARRFSIGPSQNILQSNATQYFGVAKTSAFGHGAAAHARAKADAMRNIAGFYGVPRKCAAAPRQQ